MHFNNSIDFGLLSAPLLERQVNSHSCHSCSGKTVSTTHYNGKMVATPVLIAEPLPENHSSQSLLLAEPIRYRYSRTLSYVRKPVAAMNHQNPLPWCLIQFSQDASQAIEITISNSFRATFNINRAWMTGGNKYHQQFYVNYNQQGRSRLDDGN